MTSPVRRYIQVMLSERRKLPDLSELKVTNHMNREAIQQVCLAFEISPII